MLQEIGIVLIAGGILGLLTTLAIEIWPARRRRQVAGGRAAIVQGRLMRAAGAGPQPTARDAQTIAISPLQAEELFAEIFGLRVDLASLTEDVRAMRLAFEGERAGATNTGGRAAAA